MDAINPPPFEALPHLALALNGHRSQQHIGILFRGANARIRLLHHAWHYCTRCEDVSDGYLWLIPRSFSEDELVMVAAQCVAIAGANPNGIPYGFDIPRADSFDDSRTYLLTETGTGLTCATFVLAVFETLGIDLIDLSSWEPREDDDDWFCRMIQFMKNQGVPDEHIEALTSAKKSIRFRPSEVFGAGLDTERPVSFENCKVHSERAICALENLLSVNS